MLPLYSNMELSSCNIQYHHLLLFKWLDSFQIYAKHTEHTRMQGGVASEDSFMIQNLDASLIMSFRTRKYDTMILNTLVIYVEGPKVEG